MPTGGKVGSLLHRFMASLFLLFAVLLLTACGPSPEELKRQGYIDSSNGTASTNSLNQKQKAAYLQGVNAFKNACSRVDFYQISAVGDWGKVENCPMSVQQRQNLANGRQAYCSSIDFGAIGRRNEPMVYPGCQANSQQALLYHQGIRSYCATLDFENLGLRYDPAPAERCEMTTQRQQWFNHGLAQYCQNLDYPGLVTSQGAIPEPCVTPERQAEFDSAQANYCASLNYTDLGAQDKKIPSFCKTPARQRIYDQARTEASCANKSISYDNWGRASFEGLRKKIRRQCGVNSELSACNQTDLKPVLEKQCLPFSAYSEKVWTVFDQERQKTLKKLKERIKSGESEPNEVEAATKLQRSLRKCRIESYKIKCR